MHDNAIKQSPAGVRLCLAASTRTVDALNTPSDSGHQKIGWHPTGLVYKQRICQTGQPSTGTEASSEVEQIHPWKTRVSPAACYKESCFWNILKHHPFFQKRDSKGIPQN